MKGRSDARLNSIVYLDLGFVYVYVYGYVYAHLDDE